MDKMKWIKAILEIVKAVAAILLGFLGGNALVSCMS